jgi:mannose-1-phosphate guanylyltransferase
LGDETLLQQTRRRVSRLVQPWQTLLLLTGTHQSFYAEEVAGIPTSRLLIQPFGRGTAPAILYSLLRVREMDPKGIVGFFPSDHHFSDDEAFAGHIDSAYAAAAAYPETVILLGIPPETPEPEYGWIEPGIQLDCSVPDSVLPCLPLLGKAKRNACVCFDGARLSVEQLGHGRSRSRFSGPHSGSAFESG